MHFSFFIHHHKLISIYYFHLSSPHSPRYAEQFRARICFIKVSTYYLSIFVKQFRVRILVKVSTHLFVFTLRKLCSKLFILFSTKWFAYSFSTCVTFLTYGYFKIKIKIYTTLSKWPNENWQKDNKWFIKHYTEN